MLVSDYQTKKELNEVNKAKSEKKKIRRNKEFITINEDKGDETIDLSNMKIHNIIEKIIIVLIPLLK